MDILNIGDIVAKKKVLDTSISNRYKVVVTTTINGQYGIVPVCSPFDLPMYFDREELVLIESANKEKSFLYQVGDVVSFKVISFVVPSSSITLKGLIISRYTDGRKYYKIKTLDDKNQYEVHEADIIEKLCISASEPEQQKAVNMINNIRQSKIGIGDIVSMSFPEVPFDSSTDNQYKVTDISLKDGEYGLVHVYTPFETPKFCNKNNLILRRKAGEETPFLFQKGNLVSFKFLWCNDVRIGQIEEMFRAMDNCYKIRDLKDSCLYLVEESDIERIASTIHESNSIEASNKAEPLSAAKSLEALGKYIKSLNEEKPLNIKIAKKQIKLNFKN